MAFEWVLAVAQGAEPSTPEQLQTVKAAYRAHRDVIITTLHAFTQPNDLPSMWTRRTGLRIPESVGNISTLWSAVAPSVGPVNVT